MPESLRDRQVLDTTLAIYASNGVEYTETVRLLTERLAIKPRFAPRGKSNLFEKPPARHKPSGSCSQSAQCFHDLEVVSAATVPGHPVAGGTPWSPTKA
jgi:hypothetical protein